jgi:hypothetical protein
MGSLLLILKFFGGIILCFALGTLIGHILKLDDYLNQSGDKNPEKQEGLS